jgi:hypothetical protein
MMDPKMRAECVRRKQRRQLDRSMCASLEGVLKASLIHRWTRKHNVQISIRLHHRIAFTDELLDWLISESPHQSAGALTTVSNAVMVRALSPDIDFRCDRLKVFN